MTSGEAINTLVDITDNVCPDPAVNERLAIQCLIDNGDAWRLPCTYAARAEELIEQGLCIHAPTKTRNWCGELLPSRYALTPGEPGTIQYARALCPDLWPQEPIT